MATRRELEIAKINNRVPQFGPLIKDLPSDVCRIIVQNCPLSEEIIRELRDKLDWMAVSQCQSLSEEFIREFQDLVSWPAIVLYQQALSESFLREFKDRVDWKLLSQYQSLSEPLIRDFKDQVDWKRISYYQKLSESFIQEFADSVYWDCISNKQLLSEDFIRKFQDHLDWGILANRWDLHFSDRFILEFKDKVDWFFTNRELSADVIEKLCNYSDSKPTDGNPTCYFCGAPAKPISEIGIEYSTYVLGKVNRILHKDSMYNVCTKCGRHSMYWK